jgi:hypothetical protein
MQKQRSTERRSFRRIGISRKIFSADKIPTPIFFIKIDSFEVRGRRSVEIDRSICGKSHRRKLKSFFMHSPFALQ